MSLESALVNPFRKPAGRPVYGKIGVFAESGTGKTHFALGCPKPAVIDPENGTEWFRGRSGFSDWEVMQNLGAGDVVDQVHYALSFLEQGFEKEMLFDPVLRKTVPRLTHRRIMFKDEVSQVMYPFHDRETLVIDPITLVWEQIQFQQANKVEHSSRDNKEDFAHKDWGEMKRDYKSILNRLIQIPMHVVVLARHKYEKDQHTGRVTGEVMDAEKSTVYAFDLAFQLVNAKGRRDAIIIKDRSQTHEQGDRVEEVSWNSLVLPILAKLQARGPQDDALRTMARAYRTAGVSDMAARVVMEQRTAEWNQGRAKTKSQDLTLDEIQRLTDYFLSLIPDDKRPTLQQQSPGGDDVGTDDPAGGSDPPDPVEPGGAAAAGPGPEPAGE